MAHGSMPWESENASADSKYNYHPRGDPSKGVRQAPSALNTVIVPNVNLPKVRSITIKLMDSRVLT